MKKRERIVERTRHHLETRKHLMEISYEAKDVDCEARILLLDQESWSSAVIGINYRYTIC